MEIVLKKTKVTASILKQMQYAKMNQVWTYDVLGYFIMFDKKKSKKMALLKDYDSDTYCLLRIYHNGIVENNCVKLYNEQGMLYMSYDKLDSKYAQSLKERFSEIKTKALSLGQIFY